MNVKRLKHLIKVLQAVPKKKFDITFWLDDHFLEEPLKKGMPDNFIKVDCTTAGCAMGWAGLDKDFRRQGLKSVLDPHSDLHMEVTYQALNGIEAAMEFFDIEEEDAQDLFLGDHYPLHLYDEESEIFVNKLETKHVIKRIKELLKQDPASPGR